MNKLFTITWQTLKISSLALLLLILIHISLPHFAQRGKVPWNIESSFRSGVHLILKVGCLGIESKKHCANPVTKQNCPLPAPNILLIYIFALRCSVKQRMETFSLLHPKGRFTIKQNNHTRALLSQIIYHNLNESEIASMNYRREATPQCFCEQYQVLQLFASDLELWFYVSFRKNMELNLPNLCECSNYWHVGWKDVITSLCVLLQDRFVRDSPSLSTRLRHTGKRSPWEIVDLDKHISKSGFTKLGHF